MHAADVTPILWEELEKLRALPTRELIARIKAPPDERWITVSGENITVDTRVAWADAAHTALRIYATAYGPSTWQSERCEESVLVPIDSANR